MTAKKEPCTAKHPGGYQCVKKEHGHEGHRDKDNRTWDTFEKRVWSDKDIFDYQLKVTGRNEDGTYSLICGPQMLWSLESEFGVEDLASVPWGDD
jgi:hypothetical protein